MRLIFVGEGSEVHEVVKEILMVSQGQPCSIKKTSKQDLIDYKKLTPDCYVDNITHYITVKTI